MHIREGAMLSQIYANVVQWSFILMEEKKDSLVAIQTVEVKHLS